MADARVTAAEAQGRRKSLLQGSPPTTDTDTETETETEIDTGYAELHCLSNFSFQRGASHPEELVERASRLGYAALAITDECSVAGVVRAHVEAKKQGLKLLIGAQFKIGPATSGTGPAATARDTQAASPFTLVLLARNRTGYAQLCELITAARAGCQKSDYRLSVDDCLAQAPGWRDLLAVLLPAREVAEGAVETVSVDALARRARWMQARFPARCWMGVALLHRMDDALWLHKMQQVCALTGLPLVATGQVLMHVRSRKPLQDVMTAVRLGRPVSACGFALQPNAEAHLRSRDRLAALYPRELLDETLHIAALCQFSLDELRYEYPEEVVPPGDTPASYLRRSTWEGAGQRYPQGVPAKVQSQIEHELALITELHYEKYFLTVYDIVRFARSRHILCQGRGSAANSAVCYCLGITEVDPARASVLFERFISRERNEPPDIDVDFEHQRREEVIQYLYAKYGRDRAALTAAVVTYRPRSAIRDVGKALGMDPDLLGRLAKSQQWWDGREVPAARLLEAGLDPQSRQVRLLMELTRQLIGFPRHLSQHSGGFVLTGDRLTSSVPVLNAAMPGRTTIEWDKDDIDALGLLKVDVLALGMLSAIRRALDLVGQQRGHTFALQDIPAEDPTTYDMICRADTVGVFQIESRAQQSMLPRLKPRTFYDLVIEVAIVRPGPIQGGMVHPYLRRRQGLEAVDYAGEALKPALERTLGVPIFQEQVMQIAMLAAGFSAGEADSLRRAMAAWRRKGGVDKFHQRIIDGMTQRGYSLDFAEAIFRQIEGFGEYGFPESHAASFALLVYASAWIKCHEPACFLAALLNSLPMGFYGPSQLVQDAQRHGVKVRAADVMASDWDCTLETDNLNEIDALRSTDGRSKLSFEEHSLLLAPERQAGQAGQPAEQPAEQPAVRLGLCLVSGLGEASARRIVDARLQAPFTSTEDLALRAGLDAAALRCLASADALTSLSGHRRQQVWEASALHVAPPLLKAAPVEEDFLELDAPPEGEEIVHDYAALGLTLRSHPLALLRERLARHRLLSFAQLKALPHGSLARACGLVTMRQQPQTAKGTVFVTLEDETGSVNVIVWKSLRERQRSALLSARLMAVYGVWQRDGEVRHLVAHRLVDVTSWLGRLATSSRNFC